MTTTTGPRRDLTLSRSGDSPRSAAAPESVRQLCEEDLGVQLDVEVVDVHHRRVRAALGLPIVQTNVTDRGTS